MILTCNITLQEVRALGVRKIVVVGLPPMGCLPLVITLESHKLGFEIPERGCIDSLNSLSSDYNQKLQDELMALQMHKTSSGSSSSLSLGLRLAYCDIYHPVLDMVQHPAKFGKWCWKLRFLWSSANRTRKFWEFQWIATDSCLL